MEAERKIYDVVVIGAGIAGLTAAESLLAHDKNLDVIVVEGSDRVGGRVCSQEISVTNDTPIEIDVGGEWVPSNHTKMLQLVDRLGLKTYAQEEFDCNLRRIVEVGQKSSRRVTSYGSKFILPSRLGLSTGLKSWMVGLEMMYVTRKLDQMSSAIDLLNPFNFFGRFGKGLETPSEIDSITLDTFLRENTKFQAVRDIIQIHVQQLMGHNLNSLSLLYFILYLKSNFPKEGNPFSSFMGYGSTTNISLHRINKGAFQVCRRLTQLIGKENIFLNQPVQSISFPEIRNTLSASDLVYVTSKTGQLFVGKKVILAVPPSSARNIDFNPPLPALKKFFMERMLMGSFLTFVLSYEEPYWTEKGLSGQILSNGGFHRYDCGGGISIFGGPVTVLTDTTGFDKVPTLTGHLGGRLATEWSQVQNEDILHHILSYLTSALGSWVQEYAGFTIKSWNSDPFIGGGSLSVPSIGTMFAYHTLRQSHGPVHFAGTENAINFIGTMNGAVESGHVAAIKVLDEIHPQSLSSQDYADLKDHQDYGSKRIQVGKKGSLYEKALGWTLVLPIFCASLAFLAYRMCDRYGRLLIPR